VLERVTAIPRLSLSRPEAAFYAFIRVEGMGDSVAFAKDLLKETGVGLAPGAAFGNDEHAFDDYLRLCFAARLPALERAFDRLERFMASA
jgi:aspartate aminotransferase